MCCHQGDQQLSHWNRQKQSCHSCLHHDHKSVMFPFSCLGSFLVGPDPADHPCDSATVSPSLSPHLPPIMTKCREKMTTDTVHASRNRAEPAAEQTQNRAESAARSWAAPPFSNRDRKTCWELAQQKRSGHFHPAGPGSCYPGSECTSEAYATDSTKLRGNNHILLRRAD